MMPSFLSKRPELLKEWDFSKNKNINPYGLSMGSGKRVGWICKMGHRWDAVIRDRIRDNCNCPYCSGRYASKENCLATVFPDLIKEWDYSVNGDLTPYNITSHSSKKVGWICQKGHRWMARVDDRHGGALSCPYCSGQRVCHDNCLAIVNPELAKEWDYENNYPLTPEDVTGCSHIMAKWICNIGHKWEVSISARDSGNNCPYCSGRYACYDNCLATINPELAKEWDYEKNGKLTPYDVTPGSSKKVYWVCSKNGNHRWMATVASRNSGIGCPYCSGRMVTDKNRLSIINPTLAGEWHPTKNGKLTPYDVTVSSGKKVWWKCKNGHEWLARICSRNNGNGCPYCNKIELKDGTVCDSNQEAYYCQTELIDKKIKFQPHVKIGPGKCICDFYIPSTNTYIETTGFDKKYCRWKSYYKNLLRKKRYVTKTLGANFLFVQLKLTSKQIRYVRENSI